MGKQPTAQTKTQSVHPTDRPKPQHIQRPVERPQTPVPINGHAGRPIHKPIRKPQFRQEPMKFDIMRKTVVIIAFQGIALADRKGGK
jgi:hypothetical protein